MTKIFISFDIKKSEYLHINTVDGSKLHAEFWNVLFEMCFMTHNTHDTYFCLPCNTLHAITIYTAQVSANWRAQDRVWYLKIIFIIMHLLSAQGSQCFPDIFMWEKQTSAQMKYAWFLLPKAYHFISFYHFPFKYSCACFFKGGGLHQSTRSNRGIFISDSGNKRFDRGSIKRIQPNN